MNAPTPLSCVRARGSSCLRGKGEGLTVREAVRQQQGGVGQWVALDTIEMFRGPFAKPEFLPIGMAERFPKWILSEGEGNPELRPMFNSASYGEARL